MDGSSDIGSLYDRDFYAWARAQAKALRAGDMTAVDWENVIEEIETLGRSERSALRSALANILEHLIKLDHSLNREPERGWRNTVRTQRSKVERTLEDNPSLRREVAGLIQAEYPRARRDALGSFADYEPERLAEYETRVPKECPYSEADILG